MLWYPFYIGNYITPSGKKRYQGLFPPSTDVSINKNFQKQVIPPNGHGSNSTVMSVFPRNSNSTEGKGAASHFQKCVTSDYCALADAWHGHAHWSHCSETTSKDASSAGKKYYVWKSSDLVNFHQKWIPALVALETLGCWRHLISGQLCPGGLLSAEAPLSLCSIFQDVDFSLTQQLQGGSDCSSLDLIVVRIQPRVFELSFLCSNENLCHMAAVPDFGFLIPQGESLLFALTKWQRELRQFKPIPKESEQWLYFWSLYHSLLPNTQMFSSCTGRWSQTDSAQLHYQFPPDLPSPLTSVLHEAEKQQQAQISLGVMRAWCLLDQDPLLSCSGRYFVAKFLPQSQGFTKF